MSKGDNSPGISRLAGVLRDLAGIDRDDSLVLDFGVIQSDKSLMTNSYPIAIPKSDYLVCRHLKSRNISTGTAEGHTHSVATREALEVGDHVLVAWVLDDAVVIDVILDAEDVL